MTITKVLDTLASLVSPRNELLQQRAALDRRHASEAAELQRELAKAEADVARLREPEERLARLKAEAFSAGMRQDRERDGLDHELAAHSPRELVRYATLVERLFDLARVTPMPRAVEVVNNITEERKITNLAAIERHAAVAPVLLRQRSACHFEIWRLPHAELVARLAEFKAELEQALAGTIFQDQLA